MSHGPAIPEAPGREAGFTLVEALIAVVIFAFGIIAVSNLFIVAASSNVVANQSAAATDVAAQIMEDLKAQPWPSAALAGGTYTRTDDIEGVARIESTWTITQVNPQTKFIRVQSEGATVITRVRSRAEFTTYRTCTTPNLGCP
jgi:Tfp pilus assembly protein PilV